VLRSLVERPGEVVTREDLRARLWAADTFVEFDDSLNHAVKKLREALEDRTDAPRYIETLPKCGYRFIANVAEADVAEAGPARRIQGKAVVVVAVLIVAGLIASVVYRRSRPAERLTEKDTLLLVDFVNTTGEPVFDDTLKQALSISLNQSPFLNVLSENKVIATSRMMGRPEGKPLTPDMASELCERAGGKAYIAGSIASLGYQYVVGMKAVNCANGDTLAQGQASAASKEKVLDALSVAAAKLRTELGESLTTVQKFDVPLQQATTSSLEALRAYSLGRKEAGAQGPRVALPYDQRAIQIDPNFAMGHFAVGYDYFILGEVGRASEYFSKAFELSSQVSEREKLAIAAAYYQSVTGDLDEAAQTYKEQIAIYPREYWAYLDLAIVYGQQGQYEDAVAAVRQAIRLAPDDAASYGILSYDLVASQRLDEARQAIEQAQVRKLDDLVLRQVLYALAFLKNDPSAMKEQAAWFTGKAAVENSGLSLESDTAAYTGHLRRARELTGQSVDSAVRNGHKESAAIWQANAALREAGFGNTHESRRIAGEALKLLPTGQVVETEAALALAMTGDTVRSASLAQDLSRRFPLDTQLQSLWLPTIQAQLALDKKEPTVALANLRVTAPVDRAAIQFLANVSCLYPIYVRGEAYLAAGNGVAALTEFQKILDHNGIVWNCWTGALAHLGVARANALQARTSRGADADAAHVRALAAYKDFLTLWEDADPDISILKEAKAEYAKLQV
jgi:tetratricopeptide (TPR) repeat protein